MPELKINGLSATVATGATVLDAAELLEIEIPTLCHLKNCEPETACMLCVVKNTATGQLVPACSAKAVDGMEVDTTCAEVQSARRNILNLLLSEHVGDCEAPCTRICPAHLDIPLMLREIERGNMESAAWIAKRDLAIPATLGYVCPAPCEKGCRRGQVDRSITIRDLHKDIGRACSPSAPPVERGRIAVIGAGPAGLGCAWQLRLLGYGCTIFDEAPQAGGALRDHETLPMDVLDAEIESLRQAGIDFQLGQPISQASLKAEFERVLSPEEHKLAVKAVANGKATALAQDAVERFDSKIGKLRESEMQELTKNCTEMESRRDAGDTKKEAARCLHCDCRKPVSCKLRKYAQMYGADPQEFAADERGHIQLIGHKESVIFEPGKCIKCGLCVKVSKRAGEALGVSFVGRGYNTQVKVPFGEALQDGLKIAAKECVEACPTGALAFREIEER